MLTPKTLRLLKATCPSAILTTPLVAGVEFWEAEKTLKTLAEGDYFRDEATKQLEWPANLKEALLSEADSLGECARLIRLVWALSIALSNSHSYV